ncbi:DUF2254 domain-containing protein [Albirhodobacter sp. R86504]|uniref:DUF2254 domain-containing protein n=1 Tax=Albirhodobacter sp. R86504 TaxID=3093848 RepID=UPI0036704D73
MPSKFIWALRRLFDEIWVTVVAYGVLGVFVALIGPLAGRFVPDGASYKLGADAVEPILEIVASSMLTVTTFSLSIMVAAYSAAAVTATPRALELLLKDRTTQRVLASFIGAFIFALVGIIGLQTTVYGDEGHFILFIATILVLTLIIVNLVRWVSHLTTFGRLGDTVERMENAAVAALETRMKDPYLGAHRAGEVPSEALEVCALEVGYVQHVDIARLNGMAVAANLRVWLIAMPGKFVHPAAALVRIAGLDGPPHLPREALREVEAAVHEAFTVAQRRTYDQDPEFGAITLAEVAQRALSPAVNDPGTAIDVIGRLLRILSGGSARADADLRFARVWVPPLDRGAMLRQSLGPIAREGAACREVVLHVIMAADALARMAPDAYQGAGRDVARAAHIRASAAMTLPEDLEAVTARLARAGWHPAPSATGEGA